MMRNYLVYLYVKFYKLDFMIFKNYYVHFYSGIVKLSAALHVANIIAYCLH